ncbi:hypothetical protein GCM10027579_04280 [Calidifontibacter terrae]
MDGVAEDDDEANTDDDGAVEAAVTELDAELVAPGEVAAAGDVAAAGVVGGAVIPSLAATAISRSSWLRWRAANCGALPSTAAITARNRVIAALSRDWSTGGA